MLTLCLQNYSNPPFPLEGMCDIFEASSTDDLCTLRWNSIPVTLRALTPPPPPPSPPSVLQYWFMSPTVVPHLHPYCGTWRSVFSTSTGGDKLELKSCPWRHSGGPCSLCFSCREERTHTCVLPLAQQVCVFGGCRHSCTVHNNAHAFLVLLHESATVH